MLLKQPGNKLKILNKVFDVNYNFFVFLVSVAPLLSICTSFLKHRLEAWMLESSHAFEQCFEQVVSTSLSSRVTLCDTNDVSVGLSNIVYCCQSKDSSVPMLFGVNTTVVCFV